ncbi:MAG: CTP synthase [Candidatus Latescibacteria bacterium]|nr:CTP synthase [Candidatus Latescibacterota bacterium]
MAKFIFVTGGVVSSLGKGIATASIGLLLKSRGMKVTLQKFDPYINVDPGTMSPFQHGEVFVTDDGAETDLDLGHYERFVNESLTRNHNLTTGQIYNSVIEKERKGEFLGGTIQVVPHITNEIKTRIRKLANKVDVVITEIGGTVGDIEGLPFLEAIRQMALEEKKDDVLYIHLTLVPFIETSFEYKTKPTQHSVKELREIGIQPDIILCRTRLSLPQDAKDKIALFCNVPKQAVIEAIDVQDIYEIPLIFAQQGLDKLIIKRLNLHKIAKPPKLDQWQKYVDNSKNPGQEISLGICGKYTKLRDAYKSVIEAIKHAATQQKTRVNLHWLESESINFHNSKQQFSNLAGVIIPGGFGMRGIEGKISAIKYFRENKMPFLGLCIGLQCAVIEFARNVCGLKDANSTEFNPKTRYPVIYLLPAQRGKRQKGGTMRLGKYPASLNKDSLAYQCYQKEIIWERHRHRYEVNNRFVSTLTKKGLVMSGIYKPENLVEIIELKNHPFFLATQFHPEFTSRPLQPNPLFTGFIKAAIEYARKT